MDSLPDELWATIACFMGAGESGDLIRRRLAYGIRHRNRLGWTYVNGLLHSWDDKPAVVIAGPCSDAHETWYYHGKVHRDGGLPAVVFSNGDALWYEHGKMQRFMNPNGNCQIGYIRD
jgi:hypothetical protein